MAIPPGVNTRDWAAALKQFEDAVGSQWVFTSNEDIALYRDAYSVLWGEPEERLASAAVAPDTVEQVQRIVRTANTYKIPLYPIATGRDLGYGGSAPVLSGSVVLDLKRMNRVVEVDETRHFAIVEPGVAYFDLYRYIQERKLKVWIDCPDPGWGSVIGNALDHGVGYTYGAYRDHFAAHCGMEVVLPSGDLVRTGMGAMPNASTWGEYRYGFGPYVDGLFSQGNFGIVTKMGFHLFPPPEAYFAGTVTVPRREDIGPLIEVMNYLEHSGVTGQPNYSSPLARLARDPELAAIASRPGGPSAEEVDRFAERRSVGSWSVEVQLYGAAKVIAAQWEFAKERFSAIRGARFTDGQSYRLPMTPDEEDKSHKVAFGIPNLAIFSGGARSEQNPSPRDGHVFFAPVLPKSGQAVLEAMRVFNPVLVDGGLPQMANWFRGPQTWAFRTFVFLMSIPISRSDREANKRVRDVMQRLIQVAAEHGWGEYRAAPAFQDAIMNTYSFNNNALRRLHETLKDAVDPNGIVSAGRYGVWPKHLRETRGRRT
ncbi:MAG: p-cresol methylhydroxylase [Acidobacteria bacterium RIFCSPLOWO2_02_FULL_64_15]|nr:MAG: p-cresol methylhydroxylase [Acidobacteria bacterium RIFCSPLOWO2_02_FULL_64_15]